MYELVSPAIPARRELSDFSLRPKYFLGFARALDDYRNLPLVVEVVVHSLFHNRLLHN